MIVTSISTVVLILLIIVAIILFASIRISLFRESEHNPFTVTIRYLFFHIIVSPLSKEISAYFFNKRLFHKKEEPEPTETVLETEELVTSQGEIIPQTTYPRATPWKSETPQEDDESHLIQKTTSPIKESSEKELEFDILNDESTVNLEETPIKKKLEDSSTTETPSEKNDSFLTKLSNFYKVGQELLTFARSQKKLVQKIFHWLIAIIFKALKIIRVSKIHGHLDFSLANPAYTAQFFGYVQSFSSILITDDSSKSNFVVEPHFEDSFRFNFVGGIQFQLTIMRALSPIITAIVFFPYISAVKCWLKFRKLEKIPKF